MDEVDQYPRPQLELPYKSSSIRIRNEPTYTFGSSDNPRHYDDESRLDFGESRCSSAHGVMVADSNEALASHLVATSGGATGVHENSAVIVDDQCVVAVGPYLVAFQLPSLHIVWSTQVDMATAFGVYLSVGGDCLLSHGELTICRLNLNGAIEWQSCGADIFTEGFSVEDSRVSAIDFEKRNYCFDLTTGKLIAP